ncbi:MAG TPA: hypothetical protein VGI00_10940 [Streptosporangiaceae bacterium]
MPGASPNPGAQRYPNPAIPASPNPVDPATPATPADPADPATQPAPSSSGCEG